MSVGNKWLIFAGMAMVCALLYGGVINAPFILDDNSFIINAAHVHLNKLSIDGLISAALDGIPAHRPIPKISFALNYWLGRYDPAGYHLVNICLHVLVSFFVYLLFAQVLYLISGESQIGPKDRLIALAAALVWMVHPLHTESVTYICQRMTSLCALFFIAAVLCFGKARMLKRAGGDKRAVAIFFATAVFSGAAALMSKENAAMLLFFILLYERLFFTRPEMRRFFNIAVFAGVIGFCAIALLYLGPHPVSRIIGSYARRTFDLKQRLLTETRIVVYYISLIFFPSPSRLNLDYAYPVSASLLHPPTTLLSIFCILSLLFMGVHAASKDRLLCLAIFWFLGNLIIESSFVGLELVFEHRTYLPSVFLALWITKTVADNIRWKPARISAFCLVFLTFCLFTVQRNRVWAHPVSLWADCVKKSPLKVRPNFNLACFLEKAGRFEDAIRYFSVAERLNPGFDQTHFHLGTCFGHLGKYDRSEKEFLHALKLNPENGDAHNNLANVYAATGRPDKAVAEYKKAVALSPSDASIRVNLAGVLAEKGRVDDAIFQYQKALELRPQDVGTLNDLGYLLFKQARLDEAQTCFEKALEIDPHNAGAMARMGDLLVKKGDYPLAVKQYASALQIAPDDAETHYNLGIALFRMGRIDEACRAFIAAHHLDPGLGIPSGIASRCGN